MHNKSSKRIHAAFPLKKKYNIERKSVCGETRRHGIEPSANLKPRLETHELRLAAPVRFRPDMVDRLPDMSATHILAAILSLQNNAGS